MRAACPRGGGRPDSPAPVCGSPRKPCRARCAQLAPGRADRAAAAPTPGPSLTAVGRPGGMRAGAPSCVKAGDACGDLQRATTVVRNWRRHAPCTLVKPERQVCQGPQRLVPRGFPRRFAGLGGHCAVAPDQSVASLQRAAPAAWRRRHGAGVRGPALAGALPCARSVRHSLATRCTIETGLISVMHGSNRGASRRPGAAGVATQKRVRHGVRPRRRQRGWPEVPEGLAGPDGVAAGAAAGMAPDAVPEMGLGPGWLRSQPAQPSAAMIASTAARRARRLQVTGASLRRRAGKGCAGRYAWSYCSRSPAGRRAGPALGKRRNAQYDERSARRAGGRNPSAVPAPDRASTRP
ncbi:hypothetical protein CBM2623_B10057 [Cupriavidus taiwanensis]|nr:hypothetical protein CBM2608_B10055 [Cupriavidus taiwanensis]SPA31866.1 hypothetical protein CBM2623_B10057 [Cupriavidus taiwanensis]